MLKALRALLRAGASGRGGIIGFFALLAGANEIKIYKLSRSGADVELETLEGI